VRHGVLIFERYYRGFTPDSYFTVNSVTKSVLSALVGIALRDGLIDSLDRPLASLLPAAREHAEKGAITLRQILSMTSGLPYGPESYTRYASQDRLVARILERPMAAQPGSRFRYEEDGPHLLSAAFSHLTGGNAAVFAQREMFAPIGVWPHRDYAFLRDAAAGRLHVPSEFGFWPSNTTDPPWKTDHEGHAIGGVGAHFTIREMARFGLLYARGGRWRERQIVPPQLVAESTISHSPGGSPMWMPYGYFWWIPTWHRHPAMIAAGFGGQEIYVNPALDLVVAIACQRQPGGPDDNSNVLTRYILPSIQDWGSP